LRSCWVDSVSCALAKPAEDIIRINDKNLSNFMVLFG